MLFAWIGFIREGAETISQEVNQQTTEFLQQPYLSISHGGPLWDENGRRAAMLMIFEADNRPAAEALVENSPYQRAGIYDQHHLYEYRNEVG
jgi:uncharacterized protein